MIAEKISHILRVVFELSKVKITIAVSFTTITGYVLARGHIDTGFLAVTIGIFLLACGSSVLNHIQESRTDAVMLRTSSRPIPQGRISLAYAFILAVIELAAGTIILVTYVNFIALLLGWLALIWYNLVYTNLKRITAHAVIPGALIGAIPPLVGWVAAEASLLDIRAWTIAFFFFVWQVPHFYLLVLKYGPQYEDAGLPALTSYHNSFVLKLMIFLWVVTTALSALLLYYFNVVRSVTAALCLTISSLLLILIFFIPLVRKNIEFAPFKYFMRINYYALFVIIVLNLDHLLLMYLI